MTPRAAHPSPDDWIAWIEAGRDPASELGRHLAECAECRELTDALVALQRARGAAWRVPPDDVSRRALVRRGRPAPPAAARARELRFAPTDVRAAGSLATGEPRTL